MIILTKNCYKLYIDKLLKNQNYLVGSLVLRVKLELKTINNSNRKLKN